MPSFIVRIHNKFADPKTMEVHASGNLLAIAEVTGVPAILLLTLPITTHKDSLFLEGFDAIYQVTPGTLREDNHVFQEPEGFLSVKKHFNHERRFRGNHESSRLFEMR